MRQKFRIVALIWSLHLTTLNNKQHRTYNFLYEMTQILPEQMFCISQCTLFKFLIKKNDLL